MATCEDAADIYWRLCFSTQNARSAVRLPTHLQPMARSRESTCACAAVTPSKAQAVLRAFRMKLSLCTALIFFLSIVTAVFGKNLSYSLTLNSVLLRRNTLPIFLCNHVRWITVMASKHVIFWISSSQTVARWVKVKTLLHHWKFWFWNKATCLF